MKYSIGENQSCEAKGKIRQSQPLVGQDAPLCERYSAFNGISHKIKFAIFLPNWKEVL